MNDPIALTMTSVVRQSEQQVSAEVDGDVVMLNLERGRYFGLDEIGSDIWRRIEQPTRLDTLCADLAARYDAPEDTIRQNVLDLMRGLSAEDLIEVSG